jgi:hypothetical protein
MSANLQVQKTRFAHPQGKCLLLLIVGSDIFYRAITECRLVDATKTHIRIGTEDTCVTQSQAFL